MISRESIEPVLAAAVDEWHRGRESDPTLAPRGVPDLSVVPGYSLDDVRFNCAGRQSPAQARQATKTVLGQLVGIAVGGAFVGFFVALKGLDLVTLIILIFLAGSALKAAFDLFEIREGHVSDVQGDIWTELLQDPEGPDQYFVHIGGLRLHITKQAWGALTSGGPYRIYYLPTAKRAVGGQVLPGWRPLPPRKPNRPSWWSRIKIEV
jgi:hypothetical protein